MGKFKTKDMPYKKLLGSVANFFQKIQPFPKNNQLDFWWSKILYLPNLILKYIYSIYSRFYK